MTKPAPPNMTGAYLRPPVAVRVEREQAERLAKRAKARGIPVGDLGRPFLLLALEHDSPEAWATAVRREALYGVDVALVKPGPGIKARGIKSRRESEATPIQDPRALRLDVVGVSVDPSPGARARWLVEVLMLAPAHSVQAQRAADDLLAFYGEPPIHVPAPPRRGPKIDAARGKGSRAKVTATLSPDTRAIPLLEIGAPVRERYVEIDLVDGGGREEVPLAVPRASSKPSPKRKA